MRVLEIGCGPGAAARAVARALGPGGSVVAIDRSAKAIAEARALSDLPADRLDFRCVAAEDFALAPDEAPFDLGFAFRVGALDGRHPEAGVRVRVRLAAALGPGAPLLIDGGKPLRLVRLP